MKGESKSEAKCEKLKHQFSQVEEDLKLQKMHKPSTKKRELSYFVPPLIHYKLASKWT
jgi:hypothetical protein